MSNQQPPPLKSGFGTVKQVLSGDVIILRGIPKGGPPEEMTLILDGIEARKLGRRPNTEADLDCKEFKDEDFAFEAREFLRTKLIGKRVYFTYKGKSGQDDKTPQDKKVPRREFGIIYNGADASAENIVESLVAEGLASVKNPKRSTEFSQKLSDKENLAKSEKKGIHSQRKSVRTIILPRDLMALKESLDYQPQKAIVEHVVDGSAMRLLMHKFNNTWYSIKLMLSGIKCNGFTGGVAEPYAEEAKYFVESRLLQRDVQVIIESVSGTSLVGTILHPNGNISELLLREGYAKCVDWSLQCCTTGIENLRSAERQAKERRLRLWKSYVPTAVIDDKEKEFHGKVVEIVGADALVVKLGDGSTKKIFLSSVRPPRLDDASQDKKQPRSRALYDVPYLFEAREFLRNKLIGKKVKAVVDYKQPPNQGFPERICCTVTIDDINVAEALIGKGFATAIRYRADDDQRSSHYDELLSAELQAQKNSKGVHSKKDVPVHRIVDLSGDLKSSKQYFSLIQRSGKISAIVEFVFSGSRLRLYLPRQNYLITFLLGGISCVRASRDTPNGNVPGEPFGDEALAFVKDLCMQKEVQVEVDNMDKAGNYIGWLWIDNMHLSEVLVRDGFAEVHSTAFKSVYYKTLIAAQEAAQAKKLRIWKDYEPIDESAAAERREKDDKIERVVQYKNVAITESKDDPQNVVFYAQHHEEGPKLEEMMSELRNEFAATPPLAGSYSPKKGDLCAAKFSSDDLWYRAKILQVKDNNYFVSFIDYGNKEVKTALQLASLPLKYQELPPCAHEYALAFVKLPKDPEDVDVARQAFFDEIQNKDLKINIEYHNAGLKYVTLVTPDDKDVGKILVENGYILVEKKREKRFLKLVVEYVTAQELAKKNRLNLWRYGDITEDDAKEFG